MMKSIAFNDATHPADEEGFVIVDTPQGFDSVLDDDEESYDHCDDAFSFSSLHQTLPVSSLPMESVQENFFEPPLGQEVLPPAVPSSPSLLSECDDDDDDDDPSVFATEESSKMEVVIPRIDSEVEGLCALVSSIPSAAPADEDEGTQSDNAVAELSSKSISPQVASIGSTPEETGKTTDKSSADLTTASADDKEAEGASSTPSSFSGGGTSTDDGEDDVDSSGSDKLTDCLENLSVCRLSKKKRRKQLKLAKKAAAAAAAAAALGHGLTMRSTPKRKGKNRKKVANIAVSCAVQSIAEYKEEVERTKISKKIR